MMAAAPTTYPHGAPTAERRRCCSSWRNDGIPGVCSVCARVACCCLVLLLNQRKELDSFT